VLHAHQYTPFAYAALAKLLRPKLHLVFTEHGRLADAPPSPRRRIANAFFGRIPGRFFAVSDELRRFLESEGFPAGRFEVLPNGIDLGAVPSPAARARARETLTAREDELLVGTAARLDPVKGLDVRLRRSPSMRTRQPLARPRNGLGTDRRRAALSDRSRSGRLCRASVGHRADVRDLLAGF
jgi:hypothetical protein